MRVLITGATGFIGRSLAPALVSTADVTLLLRETRSGRPLPSPLNQLRDQYEVVYADLRNFQLTLRAVQQSAPEYVIHLAAAGVTDPFLSTEVALRHNVTGTINLLRACFEKSHGVQQMVVARTPGERTAMNVYAASKAAAWNFCQMYARTQQWPIHGAMIFQAYGPDQPERSLIPAAVRAALRGDDFPMTHGAQERDWIYVDDVVAGLQALQHADLAPGTSVDLATGTLTSVAAVVGQIYALANSDGRLRPGALPSRPGEVQQQAADVARTAALLAWRANVALSEGLARTLQAMR